MYVGLGSSVTTPRRKMFIFTVWDRMEHCQIILHICPLIFFCSEKPQPIHKCLFVFFPLNSLTWSDSFSKRAKLTIDFPIEEMLAKASKIKVELFFACAHINQRL